MTIHTQSFVKVNAPVDTGLEGIITGLASFPRLETFESCQGDDQRPAWVCFRYGEYWKHPWQELAEFVLGYLAPGLLSEVGDSVSVRIQAVSNENYLGEISIRPRAIGSVETALLKLARQFTSSQAHKWAYIGGKSDT